MIKKIAVAAFVAAATLSIASVAQAEDIPAAPMNHGPMMTKGMGPMGDIANVGLMPLNMVAQPAIAVGAGVSNAMPMAQREAMMAEPAPMMKHRHHSKHMMMKKKKMMMKKKMM